MATIPALATPEIIITNGQAVTTSLAVSEYFTKQHHHVVQKIESLECSDEFLTRNFSRVQFEHRGNNYQAYEITRDGFAFLAMGFTGKKAATFKENYITAFNAMEATLNGHQPSLPECSQILLTLQNGKVIDSRAVRKNEVIASLGTFIEMAERGGYLVIHTDDLKSLSFGRKPRSDE
jgi:Rha family phage regulatory protein